MTTKYDSSTVYGTDFQSAAIQIIDEIVDALVAISVLLVPYDTETQWIFRDPIFISRDKNVALFDKNLINQVLAKSRSQKNVIQQVAKSTKLYLSLTSTIPFSVSSIILIKLVNREKFVGAVVVLSERTTLTSSDIATIDRLTNTLAYIIRNEEIFEKANRRAATLSELYRVSQILLQATSLDEILNEIAHSATILASEKNCICHLSLLEGRLLCRRATYPLQYSNSSIADRVQPFDSNTTNIAGIAGRAARTRTIQKITKVQNDPDYVQLDTRTVSQLSIPLLIKLPELEKERTSKRSRELLFGVLTIEYESEIDFKLARYRDSLQNLEALSIQASLAIRKIQRFNQAEVIRRALDEVRVNDISGRSFYEVVIEKAVRLLNADNGGLHIWDEKRQRLIVPAKYLRNDVGFDLKLGEGMSGYLASHPEKSWLIVDNYNLWPHKYKGYESTPRSNAAVLKVALRWGIRLLGVLYVDDRLGRSFNIDDAYDLSMFAQTVAFEIVKGEAIAKLNSRLQAITHVIDKTITSTVHTTLQQITKAIKNVLRECDVVTLYIFNPYTLKLYANPSSAGLRHPLPHRERQVIENDSIFQHIFKIAQPYYVVENCETKSNRFDDRSDFIERESIKAYVAIPLKIDQDRYAALFVNYRGKHEFSLDELSDTRLFANQAFVAIKYAYEYDKEQKIAQGLIRLKNALLELTRHLNVSQTLEAIAQQALQIISPRPQGFSHVTEIDSKNCLIFRAAYPTEYLEHLKAIPATLRIGDPSPKGIIVVAAETGEKQLVPDVNKPEVKDYFNSAYYITKQTGKRIYVRSQISVPLRNDDGKVIGVFTIEHPSLDAFQGTELLIDSVATAAGIVLANANKFQQLQEEFNQKKLELDERDKERTNFMAVFAHQARTPIWNIAANTDFLLTAVEHKELQVSREQQEFLELIQSNGSELLWLANNMLRHDALKQGKLNMSTFTAKEANIVEIIQNVIYKLRKLADVHSVIVEFVPPPANKKDSFTLNLNEESIGEVLVNIIHNAIKFQKGGSMRTKDRNKRVEILLIERPEDFEIFVKDNGRGLDERQLKHLQEMLNNPKPIHDQERVLSDDLSGYQIGLPIASTFIRMHDGKLTISSEGSQRGTAVCIHLPKKNALRNRLD